MLRFCVSLWLMCVEVHSGGVIRASVRSVCSAGRPVAVTATWAETPRSLPLRGLGLTDRQRAKGAGKNKPCKSAQAGVAILDELMPHLAVTVHKHTYENGVIEKKGGSGEDS